MAASAMRVKDLKGIAPTFRLNPLSLGLILGAVVGSWLLFPVFVVAYKLDLLTLYQAETLLARLNFCAKVSYGCCQCCKACSDAITMKAGL